MQLTCQCFAASALRLSSLTTPPLAVIPKVLTATTCHHLYIDASRPRHGEEHLFATGVRMTWQHSKENAFT